MLELSPFTPIFLMIAISEMALGVYVYMQGRSSPINQLFLYFTLLAGAGGLLELTMASLTGEVEASITARLLLFLLIIELGVGYHLSSKIPFDMGMLFLRPRSRTYPLAVLTLAIALSFSVNGMVQDQYGWLVSSPWSFIGVTSSLLAYVVLIVLSLNRKYTLLEDGVLRRQAGLFSFALAFPAASMLVMLLLVQLGSPVPRIFDLGEMVSVLVFSYGILRYQLFIPPRVVERGGTTTRPLFALVKGRSYLFEFREPDRMFEHVLQGMGEGLSALVICRTHPDRLRAMYRLTRTPFIWLAERPGPDRIDPTNLQLLTHLTLEFVRKGPSLIAFEGLEYILMNNEQNKVLKFLGHLRDHIIVEGSLLLVTVDPRALTGVQKAILEREFEPVVER